MTQRAEGELGPASWVTQVPPPWLQEARHLGEMQCAMRRGRSLLQRKEERLSELEASLRAEVSPGRAAGRAPGGERVASALVWAICAARL